ncbi:MAG: hypothetical protein GX638_17765, partial [Crenarchaeota archaeon]|nr:hypothetical protein [Thermoproteota archaeon]
TGNILFEVVFGQISGIMSIEDFAIRWTAIFYVYPLERLALIILAVIIGVPVIRVLKKTFFISEKKIDKSKTK